MRECPFLPFLTILFLTLVAPTSVLAVEVDVSLRGSPLSMERQNLIAHELGYDFVQRAAEVDSLVDQGELVPLEGNEHYAVNDGVSYPVARPAVRLFIERLAEQYFRATGEQLVVTSLTRPASQQPHNSHELSVHPAGIAIDFRLSSNQQARAWLESKLLGLEGRHLLDVTLEHRPPHYHVALFPGAYLAYVEGMIGTEAVARALRFDEIEEDEPEAVQRSASLSLAPRMAAAAAVTDESGSTSLPLLAVPVAVLLLVMLLAWRRP